MKLQNFDNFLLKEVEESESHAEAAKLGLQYQGFGYYSDPRTGQITHKSEGGKLVPYSGPDARTPETSPNAPDALKGNANQPGDPTGPRLAPGTGIAGAPEPGTEQHPRGANWNPGPNGDHCVGDQEPPKDLAYDTFVGKTNYYKWTAGAEGSNYKNIKVSTLLNEPPAKREHKEHSFFTFLAEGPMAPSEQGNPTPGGLGGQTPAEKAKQLGLRSNRHGSWLDSEGNIVARTVNGELVFYEPGGGAVSDSGGGSDLAMAKPTWTDPVSGMAMTPPSKPETPEEIAAVPAATPAQAPAGYERFMQQRKEDLYKDDMLNAQAQQEIEQQQMEVDQKYIDNGIIGVQMRLQALIGRAQENGSKYQMAVASAVTDKMNGDVDKFAEYFSTTPQEDHDKLMQAIVRHTVNLSKKELFDAKILPRIKQAMKDGDYDKVRALNKFNNSEWIEDEREVDNLRGVKSAESLKGMKSKVKGKHVHYDLNTPELFFSDKGTSDNDKRKEETLWTTAEELGRENGVRDINNAVEIEWSVPGGKDEDDSMNRKIAMDSLYTWRDKVLPSIPAGTVVYSKTALGGDKGEGDSRINLYKMAGFSDLNSDYNDCQWGLVVDGDDDKKRVIPLELKKPKRKKKK